MSFGSNEPIAQPPEAPDQIFVTIPQMQLWGMQNRIYLLEEILRTIRQMIERNQRAWLDDHPGEFIEPSPILEAIKIAKIK